MLYLLYLTAFLDIFGVGLLIPVTPEILSHLGLSSEWSGYALAIYAFCSFLSGFLVGRLSDRHGRKKALLGTSLFVLLANVLLAFALHPSFAVLGVSLYILSRMIAGVGASGFAVVQSSVAGIVPIGDRAKYMGYLGAMFGMAFLIGPLIGGLLDHLGGVSFVAYVIIGASVIQVLLLSTTFRETHHLTQGSRGLSISPAHSSWTFGSLWAHREIRALLVISFVATMAFSSLSALSSVYYSDRLSLDTQYISYLLSVVGVTSIFFQMAIFPRLHGRQSEFVYFFWTFIGLGCSFIFFAMITSYTQALIVSILFPLFFGGINPLISAGLSERSMGEVGGVLGANASVTGAAQCIGPLTLALIYTLDASYPFVLVGIVFFCLSIFSLIRSRHHKKTA